MLIKFKIKQCLLCYGNVNIICVSWKNSNNNKNQSRTNCFIEYIDKNIIAKKKRRKAKTDKGNGHNWILD